MVLAPKPQPPVSRFQGFAKYMSPKDVLVVRPGVEWNTAQFERWNAQFLHVKSLVKRDWRQARIERCSSGRCLHPGDKHPPPPSKNCINFLELGGSTATFHVYQDLGPKTFHGDTVPKTVRVAFAASTDAEAFAATHMQDNHLLWRTNCVLVQRLGIDVDGEKKLFKNHDPHLLASEDFCVRKFAPPCLRILTKTLQAVAVAVGPSGQVDTAALADLAEEDWLIEWTPSRQNKVSLHLYLHPRFVLQTDQLRFMFDDEVFRQALRSEEDFLALFDCPIETIACKVFDRAPLNGSMFRAAQHTKHEADEEKQQYPPLFFQIVKGQSMVVAATAAVRWAALPGVSQAQFFLCAHPDKQHTVWRYDPEENEVNDKGEPAPALATREPRTPRESCALAVVVAKYTRWARGIGNGEVRFAIVCGAEGDVDDAPTGSGKEGPERARASSRNAKRAAGTSADSDDDDLTFTFARCDSEPSAGGLGLTDEEAQRLCSPGGPFARDDTPLTVADVKAPRANAAPEDINLAALAHLRSRLAAGGGRTFLCPKCVATKGRRGHVFSLSADDGSLWVKCIGRHMTAEEARVAKGKLAERSDYATQLRPYPMWPGFSTPLSRAVADTAHEEKGLIPVNTVAGSDRPLVLLLLANALECGIAQSDDGERFGLFVNEAADGRTLVSARREADTTLARTGSGWRLETQEDGALRALLATQVTPLDGKRLTGPAGRYCKGMLGYGSISELFAELKGALLGARTARVPRPLALPRVLRLCPFPVVSPDGHVHFGRGAVPGTNRVGLGFVPEVGEAEALALAPEVFAQVRAAVHTCNLDAPDGTDTSAYKDRIASWALLVTFCAHGRHMVTSNVPMTMAIGTSAGAGKTALCKLIMCLCAWGRDPHMLTWRDNEDKHAEQLIALFRSSSSCALIDNLRDGHALESPFMEAVLTGSVLAYRVYFSQDLARAVLDTLLFMSCNGLEMKNAAMFRRCVSVHFGFTDNRFQGQTEGDFLGRADTIKGPLAQVFAHLWAKLAKTSDEQRRQLVGDAGVRGMFSQGTLSFDVCRAFLQQTLPNLGAQWYVDAPNRQMEAFQEALIEKDSLAHMLGAFFQVVANLNIEPAEDARAAILRGPWCFSDLITHVRDLCNALDAAPDCQHRDVAYNVRAAFKGILQPELAPKERAANLSMPVLVGNEQRTLALAFPKIASKLAHVPVQIPAQLRSIEEDDEVLLTLRLERTACKGRAIKYTPKWGMPSYWKPEQFGSAEQVLRIGEGTGKKRASAQSQ